MKTYRVAAAVMIRIAQSLVILTGSVGEARAGQVRLRAREHYEQIVFDVKDDSSGKYVGFTNTIDLWFEEPFRYSVGFAGSPLFARLTSKAPPAGFAEEVRLVHLGVEAKGFPAPDVLPLFARVGAYQATFDSRSEAGKLRGSSYLGGIGYEFSVAGVGLAPELSWRRGELRQHVSFAGSAPCIGVHFYISL